MTESEWLASTDPRPMLECLRGKVSDRKLRLFAAACCRTVWGFMPDDPARNAIELAERAAEGRADPLERWNALQAIGPRVNTQYGMFLCGGSEGPGSTYAAMAAVATLGEAPTFTWYMGQTPSETHPAWECVAMARAQTAKEEARERRWQEWERTAADGEEEPDDAWYDATQVAAYGAWDKELAVARAAHCGLLRDQVGNPFRPSPPLPPAVLAYSDRLVPRLAQAAYDERQLPEGTLDAGRLAVLADALLDAGCDDEELLAHLRSPGPHVRGCFAIDIILGRS